MERALLRIAAVLVVVGSVTCACQKRALLTYNTGLTPTVHGYDQRRSAVVDTLGSQGGQADFVCLQEVWFEDDMKSILDKLGSSFPHHYSAIHHDVDRLRDSGWSLIPKRLRTVACNPLKLGRLLICHTHKCRKAERRQSCTMERCRKQLYDLSQECRTCVSMASTGARDVIKKCGDVIHKFNRVNPPGLLVLSKLPLNEVRYEKYHGDSKVLVERGYIKARVDGGLTIVCTHLTSVYPEYYEVELEMFRNYEEMQAAEIDRLYTQFRGSPHILMGDLNTGPARSEPGRPVIQAEVPANYQTLVSESRYLNPYLQFDGRCTYCRSSNPVLRAAGAPNNEDAIIDHVLLSTDVRADVTGAKRMFDPPNVQLSDHYGVQLDICLP